MSRELAPRSLTALVAFTLLLSGAAGARADAPDGRDPTPTELLPSVEAAFPQESYAPGDLARLVVFNRARGLTLQIFRSGPERIVTRSSATLNGVPVSRRASIGSSKNPATGDDGTEAWMFGGPLVGASFLNCSAAGCSETNPASFNARAAGPNITEFRFNRSDIGNSSGFNFAVISLSIDPPNLNFWDVAPNSGEYTYDLVFPQCSNGRDDDGDGTVDAQDLGCSSPTDVNEADEPVNVRLGAARVVPAAPRAGSMATISVLTTRVETGRPLDGGTVRCTATYPGRRLRAAGSVVAGRAVCRLRVPAGARGKRVRGSVVVSYRGATATTAFAFRVR